MGFREGSVEPPRALPATQGQGEEGADNFFFRQKHVPNIQQKKVPELYVLEHASWQHWF